VPGSTRIKLDAVVSPDVPNGDFGTTAVVADVSDGALGEAHPAPLPGGGGTGGNFPHPRNSPTVVDALSPNEIDSLPRRECIESHSQPHESGLCQLRITIPVMQLDGCRYQCPILDFESVCPGMPEQISHPSCEKCHENMQWILDALRCLD